MKENTITAKAIEDIRGLGKLFVFPKAMLYLMFFLLSWNVGYGQIIRVSPNGTGDGDSWANASSLAGAVANADSGDELWLLEGVYEISSTITFNKTLEILGGFSGSGNQRDPALYPSIIDGQELVHMIQTGSSSGNTLFDGLSFINGYADSGADINDIKGGALYISGDGTRINDCIFRNNTSANRIGSGAIYLWSTNDIVIENSLFENNRVIQTADGSMGGGAIHVRFGSNNRIENCSFVNNSSYYPGGAIHAWGEDVQIINCHFEDNKSNGAGGAIHVNFDNAIISGSVFRNNTSEENGGAVNFRGDPSTITNSIFTLNSSLNQGGAVSSATELFISNSSFDQNTSSDQGGAVYNNHKLSVANSLFNRNTAGTIGGAIYSSEELYVTNSTFVSNEKTAIIRPHRENSEYSTYRTHVFNSVFFANTAGNLDGTDLWADVDRGSDRPDQSEKDFRRNIFQENTDGFDNQIGIDPQFVNAAGGDFRLQPTSPAIDAGDENLYNDVSGIEAANSVDLDGNPRLFGGDIDMGGYELQEEPVETVPNCTAITHPLDGATDVSLLPTIQWDAVNNATGYRLTIGTTSTDGDVLDNEDVGSVTSYTMPTELIENALYYVRVIPYNDEGNATGCPEISFTTVAVPVPPQVDDQQFCPPATVAELVATGEGIRWYDQVVGGTALSSTTVLSTGTYYATQTVDGMESDRRAVAVTVEAPEAPLFNGDITGCGNVTVAGLEDEFPGLRWYNQATGGAALSSMEAVSTGTYYASRVSGTCESDRTVVEVVISVTPVPNVPDQSFTPGSTFAELDVTGQNLLWYTDPTGSSPFDSNTVIYDGTFYVSQTINGCESDRIIVVITITEISVPDCTTITGPADGATDVALDANITWDAVAGAEGYYVSIGTTSGGADLVDNADVTTGTSYNPSTDFPEGTEIFVLVMPYNSVGNAADCSEVSFTTLTIAPNPITGLSFADSSFMYDGTQHSLAVTGTLPPNASVDYINNGRTDVGVQTVTATVSAANYQELVLRAEVEIIPAQLNVSADSHTKLYGSSDPHWTYREEGLIGGDLLHGDLSREPGENVGEYAVLQGTLRAGDNYDMNFVPGRLRIYRGVDAEHIPDAPLEIYGNEQLSIQIQVQNIWTEAYGRDDEVILRLDSGPGLDIVRVVSADLDIVEQNGMWLLLPMDTWDPSAFRHLEITLVGNDAHADFSSLNLHFYNPQNVGEQADASLQLDILVEREIEELVIPNVFTPNGDGLNDRFEIIGLSNYDYVRLLVVNQFGVGIYYHENYQNTWTGSGVIDGTYYYIMQAYRGWEKREYRGYVLIKRQ